MEYQIIDLNTNKVLWAFEASNWREADGKTHDFLLKKGWESFIEDEDYSVIRIEE